MKNVLLIGDSIRLGYQERVRELLGPDVTVYAPESNCEFAKFALWNLFSWMGSFGMPHIDVAHFNAGIWDLHRCTRDGERFTAIDDYARDIARLGRELRYYADRVIFAKTIPGGKQLDQRVLPRGQIFTDDTFREFRICAPSAEWNADVDAYNRRAEAEMGKLGIEVSDLYTPILADTDRYICDDGIHCTPEGYELLAGLTTARIRAAL